MQHIHGYLFSVLLLSLCESLFFCQCNNKTLFLFAVNEVSRNTVSPPELAADAPVLDVFEPVAIGCDVLCRVELQFAFEYWGQCYVGHMLHGKEPLLAEAWFDGCVLVAFAIAHLVVVVFNFFEQTCFLQVFCYLFAYIHTVHSYIKRTLVGDGAVGVEDVDGFEVVRLAKLIVVDVVGWCYFEATCSEFDVNVTVFDDGNDATHQRHDNLVSAKPLVLRVFGVDAHCRIAHDGFRTGGCHNGVVSFIVFVQHFAFFSC